jgi:hypothetical protein
VSPLAQRKIILLRPEPVIGLLTFVVMRDPEPAFVLTPWVDVTKRKSAKPLSL